MWEESPQIKQCWQVAPIFYSDNLDSPGATELLLASAENYDHFLFWQIQGGGGGGVVGRVETVSLIAASSDCIASSAVHILPDFG